MARLLHKPHRGGQVVPSSGQQGDRAEVRNAVKFQRDCFCLKLNKGPFLQDTGLGSGICGHSPVVDAKLLDLQPHSDSHHLPEVFQKGVGKTLHTPPKDEAYPPAASLLCPLLLTPLEPFKQEFERINFRETVTSRSNCCPVRGLRIKHLQPEFCRKTSKK